MKRASKQINIACGGFAFSISTIIIILISNLPALAQTIGETMVTMEVQQELMENQARQKITEPNLNIDEKSAEEQKAVESEKPIKKAPVVVKTTPRAFADDVEPTLKEITVTFDQPMMDGSMSWTGGGETFPKLNGKSSYDQSKTTCTLPVILEPGMVYWVGINSVSFHNFKSAAGVPARQYIILFATKASDGKPTPIPENLMQKAKAINRLSGGPGADNSAVDKASQASSDTNAAAGPDINDFNDYKQEITRIDLEARDEESKWLGRLERKTELAKAMNDVAVAELKFLRNLAEANGSTKIVDAIDLLLKKRQDRLTKLTTKLEDEAKTERRERRPPRLGGAGAGEQTQTGRAPRRVREPLQPANTNTNADGQQ